MQEEKHNNKSHSTELVENYLEFKEKIELGLEVNTGICEVCNNIFFEETNNIKCIIGVEKKINKGKEINIVIEHCPHCDSYWEHEFKNDTNKTQKETNFLLRSESINEDLDKEKRKDLILEDYNNGLFKKDEKTYSILTSFLSGVFPLAFVCLLITCLSYTTIKIIYSINNGIIPFFIFYKIISLITSSIIVISSFLLFKNKVVKKVKKIDKKTLFIITDIILQDNNAIKMTKKEKDILTKIKERYTLRKYVFENNLTILTLKDYINEIKTESKDGFEGKKIIIYSIEKVELRNRELNEKIKEIDKYIKDEYIKESLRDIKLLQE